MLCVQPPVSSPVTFWAKHHCHVAMSFLKVSEVLHAVKRFCVVSGFCVLMPCFQSYLASPHNSSKSPGSSKTSELQLACISEGAVASNDGALHCAGRGRLAFAHPSEVAPTAGVFPCSARPTLVNDMTAGAARETMAMPSANFNRSTWAVIPSPGW